MDGTLDLIVVYCTVAYVVGLVAFLPGILRGTRRHTGTNEPKQLPFITVLVCARNEEGAIGDCLRSLSALNYPKEKLEILIVDDRSSDRTPAIINEWKAKHPGIQTFVTSEETGGLSGKVNALAQGLDKAKGEIVLMTDADCIVRPNWVMEHVGFYDERVGMVSSMTSLRARLPFEYAHSLEMVEVLAMSMAGFNYDIPVSVIGNNLSVRKTAYEETGGYRKIPFSVTEDVALFQAVWRAGWKVRFKINDDIAVLTSPPDSFKTWWRQKHRWVQGGKEIGWFGVLIIGLGYIGITILLLAPFLASVKLISAVILAKCLADIVILLPTLRSIGRLRTIYYFPLYQLYLLFFLLCVPILFLQKNVKWKGRVYRQ